MLKFSRWANGLLFTYWQMKPTFSRDDAKCISLAALRSLNKTIGLADSNSTKNMKRRRDIQNETFVLRAFAAQIVFLPEIRRRDRNERTFPERNVPPPASHRDADFPSFRAQTEMKTRGSRGERGRAKYFLRNDDGDSSASYFDIATFRLAPRPSDYYIRI